ncbi:YqhR family membrane protein [Bacillus marasmi]|uniref:YqhR family membrane protein n=1 Tax=Bacillus marasmi TaxID=1926279 RepID=UPI0011C9257F|nr:YqhR family membrane protein [Bacillus marasmi]
MAEDQAKLEQSQREKPLSFFAMVMTIGFVGGLIWSTLAYFAYLFNFTEIRPNVIIEPWTIGAWKEQWLGTVISIILYGVISIGAAILYYSTLKKFNNMFVGLIYGILLFLLVFLVLNPIFPGISPFTELSRMTIITSVCLYILYGVFVGYSISYEENEIRNVERQKNEVKS